MTTDQSSVLSQIRKILTERFNDEELHALAFDLNVDYENLAGNTKQGKALEMVLYFSRRDEITILISAIKNARPNVNLDSELIAEEAKGYASAIPGELRLDFSDRKGLIGNNQRALLEFIAGDNQQRSFVSQNKLESEFYRFKKSELFYRLEQLRLLGFLDREQLAQETPPRFVYCISAQYHNYLTENR